MGGVLKYLLASAGLAFMFVRQPLVGELQPTTMGWFSQENVFAMDIYANTPARTARRFESGTPAIPSIYAGLAICERLGWLRPSMRSADYPGLKPIFRN